MQMVPLSDTVQATPCLFEKTEMSSPWEIFQGSEHKARAGPLHIYSIVTISQLPETDTGVTRSQAMVSTSVSAASKLDSFPKAFDT